MQFWVYLLRCNDGSFYTGHTDNLEARIAQHSAGGFCDYTSRRRPVQVEWIEEFPSRLEALEAERRLKSWSRAKKQALIDGDWLALSYFARPPKERPSTLACPERPSQMATEGLGKNDGGGALDSSFVSSEGSPELSRRVETRTRQRPSTSLGTNDGGGALSSSFVSSEVETPTVRSTRNAGGEI